MFDIVRALVVVMIVIHEARFWLSMGLLHVENLNHSRLPCILYGMGSKTRVDTSFVDDKMKKRSGKRSPYVRKMMSYISILEQGIQLSPARHLAKLERIICWILILSRLLWHVRR
jgi:hypothetical protein